MDFDKHFWIHVAVSNLKHLSTHKLSESSSWIHVVVSNLKHLSTHKLSESSSLSVNAKETSFFLWLIANNCYNMYRTPDIQLKKKRYHTDDL